MAEYDVQLKNLTIDFLATDDAEVLQNVAMIFSSIAGSCPMARSFAWNGEVLDRPQNLIKSLFVAAMVNALKTYEPRATLVKLTPSAGNDNDEGKTIWTVRVSINE